MKKIAMAVASLALGISGSAFAVTAESGLYLGGNFGWSFAEAPSVAQMGGATSNVQNNYTLNAVVGYEYALNQNFLVGAEMSYVNFGNNAYNYSELPGISVSLANSGLQFLATGTYLNQSGWNLFLKAGAIDEDTAVDFSVDNGLLAVGNVTNEKAWIPAAAVGVGYLLNDHVNLALQYERTFGDNWGSVSNPNPEPMTQNALTLGLICRFGI